MTPTPRRHLERDLAKLRRQLLELGEIVLGAVADAVRAFLEHDRAAAQRVRDGDQRIDQAEVALEEECLKVLALHQPVAGDLRLAIAYLKVNNDLERAGDLARNIAERALEIAPDLEIPDEIARLGTCSTRMLRHALTAVLDGDPDGARRVIADDEAADVLHRSMYSLVARLIRQFPERADDLLKVLSVSRYLERAADLATNIAEDVVFMAEGTIVRHQSF